MATATLLQQQMQFGRIQLASAKFRPSPILPIRTAATPSAMPSGIGIPECTPIGSVDAQRGVVTGRNGGTWTGTQIRGWV